MGSELDDLHGMVPDKHHTALLLIDVINQLDFEGNEGSISQINKTSQTRNEFF
jgi:hypothetical protein